MTRRPTGLLVRPSVEDDLPRVSAVERASDARFRSVGIDVVADQPAPEPADYDAAHRAGRLLAAVTAEDGLVGFVRIEILDRRAHLEQVSVHPDHQGRGVGTALLRAAEEWAQAHGYQRLTLTTFRDVAWNGPYYSRRGWVPLPEQEWGPDLAAAREHERRLGLDRWPRQAMVKQLGRGRSRGGEGPRATRLERQWW